MTEELVLGTTVLSGGRTTIPIKAMELLKLRYTPQRRQKLLWVQEEGDVVVKKGTLPSSFRKTMLGGGGKTAVPKHIREALNLNATPAVDVRLTWIQRGDDIIVRKGTT